MWKKLTVALAGAGVLLALTGLALGPPQDPVAAAPAAVSSIGSLEPIHGLAPLDEVIELFRNRSDERPNDYLSRTQLGQVLTAQAREQADLEGYEAAEDVLNEALVLNPRWQPAQLALAGAVHAQHRFVEALEIAQVVAQGDPGSISALALVGDAQLELGDLAAATLAYEDLATVERSAPVVSRLARLASLQGSHDQAIALAEEARVLSENLALRPSGRAFYWFQFGRMNFDAGNADEAVSAYSTARLIDPGNPGATEALAFALASIGDHGAAALLYEQLIEVGAAADLHGSYADSLRALDRLAEADLQEALGLQLANDTKDQFPAERRHLVGFFQSRDAAAAVELATQDLAERQDVGAYDALVWSLYHDGRFDEAAAILMTAPAGDPPYAAMQYHWAAVFAETGNETEALRLAQLALDTNPHFHPAEAAAAAALVERLGS